MTDFDVILNYLPPEGHPQDVEEDDCPYCALRRIEAELAALKEEYEEFKAHHRGGGCGCDATVRQFTSIDGMVEE